MLALVPVTFGFHPEDSVVLLAIGAEGRPFFARVDLPDEAADLPGLVDAVVVPAVRNGARQLIVVCYTDDACLAEAASGELGRGAREAGLALVTALRADGQRWYPLGLEHPDPVAADGVAYDLRTHELTTRSVLEGRVTYGSRDELAESLAASDWERVEAVMAAHDRLPGLPASPAELRAEARWARDRVAAHGRGGQLETDAVARLLRAVAHPDLRDALWCEVTPDDAPHHVRVWREVVRSSPEELVAPAAGLLALSAWLSGDGALAWCGVERSLRADPDQTLARLVGDILEAAAPPSAWRPMDVASLSLFGGPAPASPAPDGGPG